MRKTADSLIKGSASSFYATFLLYLVIAGASLWIGMGESELNPMFYMGMGFAAFAFYTLIKGLKLSRAARA